MELKASVINSNLLCESAGDEFGDIELKALKDLWQILNAGVPGCGCHQCLRRQFQV